MERLLINMAIVKVNWDRSGADLLENYIPLLAHALSECKTTTISLSEIRERFRNVAEFNIPIAALGTLIKRASKKHGFLSRQQDGTFEICVEKLPDKQYRELRNSELRKYHALRHAFITYCESHNIAPPTSEEIDSYFFDVLYDVAPTLIGSTATLTHGGKSDREPKSVKVLVARFVTHCYESDPASSTAIESYVRGAMLTETFYYSAPESLTQKMRDVAVYFDTGFLLRALGLCEQGIAEPCEELTQILRGMSVKMRCFRDTYNEIHRILHAASHKLQGGRRLVPRSPGDIFDYYSSIGARQSDVELDIAMLEKFLNRIGVKITDRPEHKDAFTVDEEKLSQYIEEVMPGQTVEARQHDIDCLTSIFRLRSGREQPYLESCVAIFITTNVELARASTRYFNENEDVSVAPICMADQVFTTLVWLKSVNKLPNLPKHRLVANCIAATQPTDRLWKQYLTEANSLHEKREISEDDYAVLVHSLEARHHLMDSVIEKGDFLHGTVKDVLSRARATFTQELGGQLQAVERGAKIQRQKLEGIINAASTFTAVSIRFIMLSLWVVLIIVGLFVTAPKTFTLAAVFDIDAWLFCLLALVGILNLVWGMRLYDSCDRISRWISAKAETALRRLLIA